MDVVAMGAAALFIRRTDAPDWNNAFINFDYQGLLVAPNYLVTELWENHYSPYRLAYEGDTKDLSVSATLAENAGSVIVKVVNPTDKPYTLTLDGNWGPLAGASYEYYAPGDLLAANTMEQRHAIGLKTKDLPLQGERLVLDLEPLSAGVITLQRQ